MTTNRRLTRLIAPVLAAAAALAGAQQLTAQTQPADTAPQARIVLAQSDAPATSGQFELGTHYQRFSPTQPTSSSPEQIEVAEVFWYGCPHCYTFDPYLESWKQDLPANVNFVRIPAVWNPLLQLHARAFYTAEALGRIEEMHTSFFREIHVNGNFLDSEQALQAFFGEFGVSAENSPTRSTPSPCIPGCSAPTSCPGATASPACRPSSSTANSPRAPRRPAPTRT